MFVSINYEPYVNNELCTYVRLWPSSLNAFAVHPCDHTHEWASGRWKWSGPPLLHVLCGGGKWQAKRSEVIQHSCVNQPALGNQWPHSGEWIQCRSSLVTLLGLKNSRFAPLCVVIAHCLRDDGPARCGDITYLISCTQMQCIFCV